MDHDLTGAAVATSQGETGISCILGTGSNSCYFDGSAVHEEVPALGYILGDEGSGSFFGKKCRKNGKFSRKLHLFTTFALTGQNKHASGIHSDVKGGLV